MKIRVTMKQKKTIKYVNWMCKINSEQPISSDIVGSGHRLHFHAELSNPGRVPTIVTAPKIAQHWEKAEMDWITR